jgi:phosphoglycerate dehydrogenase-like enzyme
VEELALTEFLRRNPGAHYSTDVLCNESERHANVIYNYFLEGGNVTLTPHVGGMTTASRTLAYSLGVNKILKFRETKNA